MYSNLVCVHMHVGAGAQVPQCAGEDNLQVSEDNLQV